MDRKRKIKNVRERKEMAKKSEAQTEIPRVTEFQKKEFEGLEIVDKDDLLGVEIIIEEVHFLKGTLADGKTETEYMAIRFKNAETKEKAFFQTGAKAIKTKMKAVTDANGFPTKAKIVKRKSQQSKMQYYDME